jgi:hypothetical protein
LNVFARKCIKSVYKNELQAKTFMPRYTSSVCFSSVPTSIIVTGWEQYVSIMKKFERLMIQSLMVMMAIVLGLATLDLGWLILKDIMTPPYVILSVDQLLDFFGLFMLVLIGIELLETIMKTYLSQEQPHYEIACVR